MKLLVMLRTKLMAVSLLAAGAIICLPVIGASTAAADSCAKNGTPACYCQTNTAYGDPTATKIHSPGDFCLMSSNIEYFAKYQNDGNLVVYRVQSPSGFWTKTAIWSSQTNGKLPATLDVLSDGNFGIFQITATGQRVALWQTATWGHASDRMAMNNDGYLTVYAHNSNTILWQS